MSSASDALRRAVAFAGSALVAMVLSALATVVALVGALAVMLRSAFVALRGMVGVVARVVCVAGCVVGLVYGIAGVGRAFGGDVASFVMAGALLVVPVAYVLVRGVGWGGFLLCGALAFVAGAVFPAIHPVMRVVVLAAALGAGMLSVTRTEVSDEGQR